MYDLIAKPLQFFYELWPNYAGAISLLTLTIMILLLPLTLKGTRSMLAMQKLQPELKKIQAKYKDDRQKLNEEMMAFYKEHNINPVSGCLPLLLQMPVFLILYRTLFELLNKAPFGSDMGAAAVRSTTPRWPSAVRWAPCCARDSSASSRRCDPPRASSVRSPSGPPARRCSRTRSAAPCSAGSRPRPPTPTPGSDEHCSPSVRAGR